MNASVRLAGPEVTDVAAPSAKASVSILVVDDDAAKRLGLKAVLLPLGYSIVEANSGLAALRCVTEQSNPAATASSNRSNSSPEPMC